MNRIQKKRVGQTGVSGRKNERQTATQKPRSDNIRKRNTVGHQQQNQNGDTKRSTWTIITMDQTPMVKGKKKRRKGQRQADIPEQGRNRKEWGLADRKGVPKARTSSQTSGLPLFPHLQMV